MKTSSIIQPKLSNKFKCLELKYEEEINSGNTFFPLFDVLPIGLIILEKRKVNFSEVSKTEFDLKYSNDLSKEIFKIKDNITRAFSCIITDKSEKTLIQIICSQIIIYCY